MHSATCKRLIAPQVSHKRRTLYKCVILCSSVRQCSDICQQPGTNSKSSLGPSTHASSRPTSARNNLTRDNGSSTPLSCLTPCSLRAQRKLVTVWVAPQCGYMSCTLRKCNTVRTPLPGPAGLRGVSKYCEGVGLFPTYTRVVQRYPRQGVRHGQPTHNNVPCVLQTVSMEGTQGESKNKIDNQGSRYK